MFKTKLRAVSHLYDRDLANNKLFFPPDLQISEFVNKRFCHDMSQNSGRNYLYHHVMVLAPSGLTLGTSPLIQEVIILMTIRFVCYYFETLFFIFLKMKIM